MKGTNMLCVTMNDIPGWDVQRVCGEVFGVTVRSRNIGSQIGASFKSMVGGELLGMTKNVISSRNEAMARLFAEAQARGGNAIIAMRFDTTELGSNWSEICAYGTAVVAVPVTDAARQTATQLGYGRPVGSPQDQPAAQAQGQSFPDQQQPPAQQWAQQPAQGQPFPQQSTGQEPPAPPAQPEASGQTAQPEPWGQTEYPQPLPPQGQPSPDQPSSDQSGSQRPEGGQPPQ
jgi:uncharacterized protein YbjQ (UPF0145 family)